MNHERALTLLQGTASPLPPEDHAEWEELTRYLEEHPDLDHWFRLAAPENPLLRAAFTSISAPQPGEVLIPAATEQAPRSPVLFPTPRRHFLKVAASIAVGAGAAWWLSDPRRAGPLPYASAATVDDFRQEIAEYCAGHYKLDVKGVTLDAANEHLTHAGATTPCSLPEGIRDKALIGCKVIEWRGRKVGMTCFDCGKQDVVHVFTVALDAFSEDPCPVKLAELRVCCERETAGWIADKRLHLAVAAKPGYAIADLVS